MKNIVSIAILFLSLNAHAGFYLGAFGGKTWDDGDGIEKLEGSNLGFKFGWRWSWFALELSRSTFDMKTETGQAKDYFIEKGELSGASIDIIGRFFLFKYLSLFFGVSDVDSDDDIRLTNINGNPGNSFSSEGGSYSTGNIFGVGLHYPINYNFEIFGEYAKRKWDNLVDITGYSLPALGLSEWRVGVTWYWGSGERGK